MISRQARRVCALHLLLAVGSVWLVGCEFKGGQAASTGEGLEGYWQPRPASLRVYPSSRFVQMDGRTVLEARLELRDEMDDAVKAAGQVRLELFAREAGGEPFEERLYRWDVQMRTLEDQRTHFDPVTRTYLFRLELDAAVARGPTVLRATFDTVDSRRLQADAPIQQ